MKATIDWISGALFSGDSGSGHRVLMDGPTDSGGRNLGIRPMEMVLMGLGGCASFDIVDILKKGRHAVASCSAELDAERAEAAPAVFTRIHIHFKVSGHDLPERAVARAIELSASKYCSASIMLASAGVEITHDYEIVEPPPEELEEDEIE